MKVKDLAPNPKNPRTITENKNAQLSGSMHEHGDVSGVIYNRTTKKLVGGHQRINNFDKDTDVVITKTFKKPTRSGTVAIGHILLDGEYFNYREVKWDKTQEKAANLAANKNAGDWDDVALSAWIRDLDFNGSGYDLELTMFDKDELEDWLVPSVLPKGKQGAAGKAPKRRTVVCPKCECEFTPAPRG